MSPTDSQEVSEPEGALENAWAELLLAPGLDTPSLQDVERIYRRHHVAALDFEAVATQDLERLWVYRRLVRGNFRSTLELTLTRTLARLGQIFDEYFDRYLAHRASQTHLLREIADEFLQYSEDQWKTDPRIPGYLWDLAQLEAAQLRIAASPNDPIPTPREALDLSRGVQFTRAMTLLRLSYAVHLLPDSAQDNSLPVPGETTLLLYRNADYEVKALALTPLAATLIEELQGGAALGASLTRTVENPKQLTELPLLEGTASLLADLASRGVVLGPGRPQE